MMNKTYSELSKKCTYKERLEYLDLSGTIGNDTFGFSRFMNQDFYRSYEWKKIRDYIIVRDQGNEMGLEGYPIYGKILVHHINPISKEDILNGSQILLDPENLISLSSNLHNIIHYGDVNDVCVEFNERYPNDVCPWKNF